MADEAFVIMQIGNLQLDRIWSEVYLPVIKECGLEPKRVDKHTEGRLLNSEVAEFINRAKIIIADLTNERPNCYLEVGYAMGKNKFQNLILCAREDHNQDSLNYTKGGPKIHFDLSGYSIIWWEERKLNEFKTNLKRVIENRMKILKETGEISAEARKIDDWIKAERKEVLEKMEETKLEGYLETSFYIPLSKLSVAQPELLNAIDKAQIHTFGWPIGVVMHNREEFTPKPFKDGIRAIIYTDSKDHFDYWTLKKNGDFYLIKSLFEDSRAEKRIFFDTRIVRITEVLMFCYRLYKNLGVKDDNRIVIRILHSGLKGRTLTAANPARVLFFIREQPCIEDEVETIIENKLDNINTKIKELVYSITQDLFVMFNYFIPARQVVDDIVDNFIKGKIQ